MFVWWNWLFISIWHWPWPAFESTFWRIQFFEWQFYGKRVTINRYVICIYLISLSHDEMNIYLFYLNNADNVRFRVLTSSSIYLIWYIWACLITLTRDGKKRINLAWRNALRNVIKDSWRALTRCCMIQSALPAWLSFHLFDTTLTPCSDWSINEVLNLKKLQIKLMNKVKRGLFDEITNGTTFSALMDLFLERESDFPSQNPV